MKRTSQIEAASQGLVMFFTGIPCKHNHVSTRLVKSGKCIACNKASREKRIDRIRIVTREWRVNNKERIRNKIHSIMQYIVKRIRKRAPDSVLTAHGLVTIWDKQEGLCALTKFPMVLRPGKQHLMSASVDRINCKKGYTLSNVRFVTVQVNSAKLFGTDDELIAMCKAVLINMRVT